MISLILIFIFVAGYTQESHKWSTLFTPLAEENSVEGIQSLHKQGKFYFQLKKADIYFLDYGIYSYNTVNGIKSSEEKLSQVYGVLVLDDGYLLTLLPKNYLDMSEEELTSVTAVANLDALNGNEYHMEAYDEMVTTLSDAFGIDSSVVKENVPEICVTIPENGRLGDQALFLVILSGFLISLAFFLYQLLIIFNYRLSKFYRKLAKTGNAEDIEYSINRAAADGTCLYINTLKSAGFTGLVTSDYIIGKKNTSLMLGNTKDLVWVHLKLIRHKTYFITVGKSYQVLFYFKGVKAPITINCNKEETAAGLIGAVSENLRVCCEYSDELAKLYRKNYDAFLKEVTERVSARNQEEYGYDENSEAGNYRTDSSETESSREESNTDETTL